MEDTHCRQWNGSNDIRTIEVTRVYAIGGHFRDLKLKLSRSRSDWLT